MEISIFSKRCQTREGKTFFKYLSTLKTKAGEPLPVQVKFRDECGSPKPDTCPCNIIVTKEQCNLSKREYTREDTGEVCTARVLWVNGWKPGSAYVDHSMDDIDI